MQLARTVHLIDDDEALSDALACLFQGKGYRVRCYGSADAFAKAWPSICMANEASVVVSDVCMPGRTGLDLLRELRAQGGSSGRRLPFVILSAHATVSLAVQAMQDGAVTVLEKPADPDEIISVVANAFENAGHQMSPEAETARARLQSLTAREQEVLRSFIRLGSNKAVAVELGMSPRTVEIHRTRIFRKSSTNTVPELVRLSLEAGISV